MRKLVHINRISSRLLVCLCFLLSGCSIVKQITELIPVSETNNPGAKAQATQAIHYPKADSNQWVKSVSSLCLVVDQSYSILPADYTQPIGEELQSIFDRIGVKATLSEGTDCQATLKITVAITPLTEYVSGGGNCYLDAEAKGQAILTAPGQKTMQASLDVPKKQRSGVRIISKCPKQPEEAPIETTWAQPLSAMLSDWWGGPALVSMLESEIYYVRFWGISQLKQMGAEASGAIPVLIEMLSDDQLGTRAAAAEALGEFGEQSIEAAPALIEAIQDKESVRYAAIQALGKIGGDQALQALINTLHHSDWYTRFEAANALAVMGKKAAPAIPDLIETIDDEQRQVGTAAMDALAGIGPEAKTAVPKLIEKLAGSDWTYHYEAENALKKITGKDFGKDAAAWKAWWDSQP